MDLSIECHSDNLASSMRVRAQVMRALDLDLDSSNSSATNLIDCIKGEGRCVSTREGIEWEKER